MFTEQGDFDESSRSHHGSNMKTGKSVLKFSQNRVILTRGHLVSVVQ